MLLDVEYMGFLALEKRYEEEVALRLDSRRW